MKRRNNLGTIQVWATLFLCLNTRGLRVYLARSYNTEDFLMCFDEFVADSG
jgi:hypothetical protein